MNEYIIYEHISPSGKVYVGQTCNLKRRWMGNGYKYLSKNKNGKYAQPIFAHALLKYGWNNFTHKIILEGISKAEANYAEMYLIKWYKLHKKSYNITDGGEGCRKPISEEQRKQMVEYMRKYNPRKGKHHTEEAKRKISAANKGRKVTLKERENMRKSHLGSKSPWKWKRVYAFDKNTKKLVAEFPSITEAAKYFNLSVQGIGNVARGKCNSAGNYVWSYSPIIDKDDKRFIKAENKSIYCYDKDYNLVGIYKGIVEAALSVNGNKYSLANCCCGNYSTYKGYIWTRNKINNDLEKGVICA